MQRCAWGALVQSLGRASTRYKASCRGSGPRVSSQDSLESGCEKCPRAPRPNLSPGMCGISAYLPSESRVTKWRLGRFVKATARRKTGDNTTLSGRLAAQAIRTGERGRLSASLLPQTESVQVAQCTGVGGSSTRRFVQHETLFLIMSRQTAGTRGLAGSVLIKSGESGSGLHTRALSNPINTIISCLCYFL